MHYLTRHGMHMVTFIELLEKKVRNTSFYIILGIDQFKHHLPT